MTLFVREPRWSNAKLQVPRRWKTWLLDQGSLTARLQQLSGGQFSVHRLSQAWGRPTLSERRALGLDHHQLALVREVLLYGGDQPWVYARSILPAATLTGPLRSLRQLDEKPLGALLFSNPTMCRGDIEVAKVPVAYLPPSAHGVVESLQETDALWGRRSVFFLYDKPLLVSETFLPEFPG
ncbi:MAG: chorismate lyase [Cellvibrionaceae bacterium]